MPGDRFCDACGAALAPAPSPSIADVPTAAALEPPWAASAAPPVSPPPVEPVMPTLIEAAPPPIPPAAPATPVEQPLPPAGETVAPPVETAAPSPASLVTDAQAEYEAKRQTLLDEIARQDQIVAQLEQMQATFGAATPHAITLALAEARDALAKAQAELAALGVAPPAAETSAPEPPPAPVIAEPVAPTAAHPLEPAAPPPPAHPVAPAAPLPFTAPPVSETAVTVTSPPEALPSAATVLAPPAGPRLVFESGQEIPVPTDKTEITIGREDPISGIHPEIDLTPYGGESGGVSRQHARLINKGGQWSIVDLGSTNYTRVDGLRIEPGAPHPLNDGARLQFGRLTVTFRM